MNKTGDSSSEGRNDETGAVKNDEHTVRSKLSIPFSSIYNLHAKTVDLLLNATELDVLPGQSVEDVLGMGGDHGRILYGAVQTLLRHGRISRTMLEQAMSYDVTSYREYLTLWLQSLPPQQRSLYTAELCQDKFKNLPWETDPKFTTYFERMMNMTGNEGESSLIHRTQPPNPLGDNRHDPLPAKAARLAQDFYNIFSYDLVFFGQDDSPPSLDSDDTNLYVLNEFGALFGINAPELPWGEQSAYRLLPEVLTVPEMMLRAWNTIYMSQRLSVTELECALMQGNVRQLMATAVEAALSVGFNQEPFWKKGRTMLLKAKDFLSGDYASLPGDQRDHFHLVFADLTVDEGDTELLECDYCGSELKKVKQCSRCKVAMYCTENCQKNDWARHKPLCSHYIS